MTKNIMGFLLVFCIFAVGAELMAEDTDVPTIKNLSVVREGAFYKFSFDFFNVRGGLAKASFVIGYRVVRENAIIRQSVEEVEVNHSKIILEDRMTLQKESGRFETVMFATKKADKTLKTGDRVIYFILLTDKDGRESNIATCEFTFAELIEI